MSTAKKPPSDPIPLKNLLDGTVLLDTLHHKAYSSGTSCSRKCCNGSIVRAEDIDGIAGFRLPSVDSFEEQNSSILLREAEDFITQYYTSLKRKDSFAHSTRWEEVRNQIVTSGTYQLKETELAFGAKTAWRNTPRCIGRMFWNQLQVFDARSVRTSQEMYNMMCNHLRFATNKGNIRSAMTVFPPRLPHIPEFRIWNSQLISYAGYESKDGVIGDPQSKAFTQICLSLGWKSPSDRSGRFDILPWIIQAAGQPPELMEVPKDIIMEVKITHPEYDFFSDLNLKWYTVPCIANIKLRIGGLEFPACPFNGWYMDTEIACRDLCDENRYNILPALASGLGLDTSRSSSMWKEKAQTEMLVAVVHSFQAAGVVMIDHHKACELFEDHLRNETSIRGGCPADWVWIVPPSHANLTSVFHQEMLNYKLLPAFEYQDDAWNLKHNHNLFSTKKESSGVSPQKPRDPSLTNRRQKPTFKGLVRSIIIALYVMRKCIKRRTRVLILYGTQSGRSRRYASKLAQLFRQVFNVRLAGMDEYDANELRFETVVLIVSSTFGNGDPPAMGEEFSLQLFDLKMASLAAGTKTRRRSSSFVVSLLRSAYGETEPSSDKGLRMRIFYSGIKDAVPGELSPFLPMVQPVISTMATIFSIIPASPLSGTPLHNGSSFETPDRSPPENGLYFDCPDSRPTRSAPAKLNPHNYNDEFPLENICFAVFGLGSSAYPKFCGFAAFLNNLFGDLGAERLMPFKTGDELSEQEKAFQQWQQEVFQICIKRFDVQIRKSLQLPHLHGQTSTLWSPSKFRGTPVKRKSADFPDNALSPGSRTFSQLLGGLSSLHHKSVQGAVCLEVRQLLPPDAGRQILLIRLDISRCENFAYEPGDHILVFPNNQNDVVSRILERCTWDLGEISPSAVSPYDVMMQLEPAIEGSPTDWADHNRLPGPLSVRFALTYLLDIAQAPSQSFLLELAQVVDSKFIHDREKLLLIATDSTAYANWISDCCPTLLDTMLQFNNVKWPVSLLLTQLPLLEARYYSVSSSRKMFPKELHITADVISYGRDCTSGLPRIGLCSRFWTVLKPGDVVPCSTRTAAHFRLPSSFTKPIVLIGPGTGIAPFRSFWQELEARVDEKTSTPDVVLYFGCRRPDVDDFYAGELANTVSQRGLRKVYKAYSREPGKGRTYVQDLMQRNAKEVYQQCVTSGGHIYICGDVRMVTDVQRALLKIFHQEGGMSESAAKEYFIKMTEENRFHEDIFGLNSNEDSSNGP